MKTDFEINEFENYSKNQKWLISKIFLLSEFFLPVWCIRSET